MALPVLFSQSAPVSAAPMAGGASSSGLVIAAGDAGHFAQLAAGYKTPDAMRTEIGEVRAAGSTLFGINLFVPNTHPVSDEAYQRYWNQIASDALAHGHQGPMPVKQEDDDGWFQKVELLLSDPVPAVSFTFGLPSPEVFERFRSAGTVTLQTVTTPDEARRAEAAGADVLVVQGWGAGGHSGIWDPNRLPEKVPLTRLLLRVRDAASLPMVAAGGITRREHVYEALDAGADAVAVGTALLRSQESGAAPAYKDALVDPQFDQTLLTRAFTGRPARALVNRFVAGHDDAAPVGYPAVHHLTRSLRSAATASGDTSAMNLWAGVNWRDARDAPVATILHDLTPV